MKTRRETKRFTPKQIQYLTDKFNVGAQTGRKYDPHDIAKQMRSDELFKNNKDQWLTWQQIGSFWSRLAQKREQAGVGGASAVLPTDEFDLAEIEDNEYANAFDEHIRESIDAVIREVIHMTNAPAD